jgi:hypothetical protein
MYACIMVVFGVLFLLSFVSYDSENRFALAMCSVVFHSFCSHIGV